MEQPTDNALAKHLGLKPNEPERELGHKSGAALIERVADCGERWGVITVRGSKHYIAKAEL